MGTIAADCSRTGPGYGERMCLLSAVSGGGTLTGLYNCRVTWPSFAFSSSRGLSANTNPTINAPHENERENCVESTAHEPRGECVLTAVRRIFAARSCSSFAGVFNGQFGRSGTTGNSETSPGTSYLPSFTLRRYMRTAWMDPAGIQP
jgi:hypothetical protein